MKSTHLLVVALLALGCQDNEFSRSGDSQRNGSTSNNPNNNNPGNNGTANPNFSDPNTPAYTGTTPDSNGNGFFGDINPWDPFWQGLSPNPFFQSFGGRG